MRWNVALSFLFVASLDLQAQAQTAAVVPAPQHKANFDAERKQADELFTAQKTLEALPLYEDLCAQDATIAVFAERHGTGLLTKSMTIADAAERQKVHAAGIEEIKRAQSLGDNSTYVRTVLSMEAKSFVGAVLTGVPLTVGYTHRGTVEAQSVFREAETAFAHTQWAEAAKLYEKAAELDPQWYDPALYAGDSYFRLKDVANASVWFAKAVTIDPDRETAYRYWGDLLAQTGDPEGARAKFVDAVVAEPYGKAAFNGLEQWAKHTGHQLQVPTIQLPKFVTPGGELKIDPELAASVKDGRASWIAYEQYRVAHGARTLTQPIVAGSSDINAVVTPSGYRHTIAEEHAALRAMLADLNAKIKAGMVMTADLDVSVKNVAALEANNVLGAWIAINAADAGIRSDYAEYRAKHRKHLAEYVNSYLIH